MKKITIGVFLLASLFGFSQNPLDKIKAYANKNTAKSSLLTEDVSDLVIVNEFSSETTGINNYHVKQRCNGIEVYNSDSNFLIKNGQVFKGGEDFIPNIKRKVNASVPVFEVQAALLNILPQLNETKLTSVQILEKSQYEYKLSNGALADYPITAELVYFKTDENTLKLAWDYEFYSQDLQHLWNLKVDALTGKLLEKNDMVLTCNFSGNHVGHAHYSNKFTETFFKNSSAALTPGTTNYRVIPWNFESPNHTSRQLVTNPETANASPNGWHSTVTTIGGTGDSSNQFTRTQGNNVNAYDDVYGSNTVGSQPTGTGTFPNLTFDFPYPGTTVEAFTYMPAALTNLFYMNNIMHDLWYQYGFDERNKNFQMANYGRGGTGNDAVNAEAQDGSQASPPNLNNANFSTPAEGQKPRMQMYLWNVAPTTTLTINAPSAAAGAYAIVDNNFNPGHVGLPIAPAGLSGTLVLYNDGTPDTSDACTAPVNAAALSGKIAVIRRGDCEFIAKVKRAQLAGAIAVLIVNNVDGNISMGGADGTITIPAVSISKEDGEKIIAALTATTTGTMSAPAPGFVNSDGDLDNGIIAHEYGHGISARLSGNCLNGSEQMGEGWSDWYWLMMQIKPGDTRNDARGFATFAVAQPPSGPGIRPFRYSPNMSVNPLTYGDTNEMWYNDGSQDRIDVHSVGSVWCTILWDLAWNYIDKYGYDPNIYTGTGGNNKVMRLVLDAIKIDGCTPTFVTGRDALIDADQATTGGQNYCLIWQTFARRGVGLYADSGTNSGAAGIQDQIEDFTVPAPKPSCTLAVDQFQNEKSIRVYPNPTKGLVNIAISDYSGELSIQVFDLNGRKVYSQDVNNFSIEGAIQLGNLQSGIYLIKVNGENINYTQKIILN
ncbi:MULTISPECIES: T9SS-dependent M36 family metallopeptidase [Flavobacterium]|uniref:T9SS-dependent M36 family metallopeptidase n=1 Tax=Flavobacterium TaxID=237 RepID=UPI001FCB29F8|nr:MULTISPECIES: T9SS-dependent M36 family metallopeptidase [Flavobacterium]UOK42910.1 T9SS-dependent M36 family metallopeptidase [Flavobacterium enshiense]